LPRIPFTFALVDATRQGSPNRVLKNYQGTIIPAPSEAACESRHRIGAIGADSKGLQRATLTIAHSATARSGMVEIVNLRMARKRALRDKAERRAAEQRVAHGVPKSEREHAAADRDQARQTLDQHRIEPGDRR
jgi:hypothetical protein